MDSAVWQMLLAAAAAGGLVVYIVLRWVYGRRAWHDRAEIAALREHVAGLQVAADERRRQQTQIQSLIEQVAAGRERIAHLQATLDQEQRQAAEKINLLEQAREQLKIEFENLSNRIFDEKGRQFARASEQRLAQVLDPLRQQLGDFKQRVEDVHDHQTRDRAALINEIGHLKALNQQISQDALSLTQALKGDSKMRGNWGEVLLERVLEASGLQKGREYDLQVRLRGPTGKIYQPDAIIRLPAGKDVVVDAKMTLNAYARYHALENEADRRQALKQHVDAVRGHVRNLAAKPYAHLQGVHSLDFVLMFIPVEAAFLAAAETDNNLWQDACGQNIMIVSPSTLLLTLRIIHNVWRHEYQNRNTLEIARQAGALHDKFVGFVDSLTEVGDRLDKAAEAYHTAFQRLTGGRGNLVRRAHALKQLGARASRELPADVLAAADVGSEI